MSADPDGRPDQGVPSVSADAAQRAAFRAFVRRHHPDVGGDPEVFREGLARFRALGIAAPADTRPGRHDWGPADDDPRLEAPITAVPGDPLHRLGRAGRRVWRRSPLHRGPGRVI